MITSGQCAYREVFITSHGENCSKNSQSHTAVRQRKIDRIYRIKEMTETAKKISTLIKLSSALPIREMNGGKRLIRTFSLNWLACMKCKLAIMSWASLSFVNKYLTRYENQSDSINSCLSQDNPARQGEKREKHKQTGKETEARYTTMDKYMVDQCPASVSS